MHVSTARLDTGRAFTATFPVTREKRRLGATLSSAIKATKVFLAHGTGKEANRQFVKVKNNTMYNLSIVCT